VKGDSTEFVRPVDTSKTCPHISDEDHKASRLANIEDAVTRCAYINHYHNIMALFVLTVLVVMVWYGMVRFNKWGEVEALREKYTARQALKEKLNYQHFLDLGLSTRDLHVAKGQFCAWLESKQQQEELLQNGIVDSVSAIEDSRELVGDTATTSAGVEAQTVFDCAAVLSPPSAQRADAQGAPATPSSSEDKLASLLKGMTVEDTHLKLKLWYAESSWCVT
jgi:predicted RND superfamily exporter protein